MGSSRASMRCALVLCAVLIGACCAVAPARPCPGCGGEVADTVNFCPECGRDARGTAGLEGGVGAAPRAGQAALLRDLDLGEGTIPAPPDDEGAPTQLNAVCIRLGAESGNDRDAKPIHQEKGIRMAFFVEMPASVIEVTKVEIERCVADNGESLLGTNEWDRRMYSARLTKDRTGVTFDCTLLPPSAGVKSLREVAGTIEYRTATGTRDVDLGRATLKTGAPGGWLDPRIVKVVKTPSDKGPFQVGLTVYGAVKDVKFFDAANNEIAVKSDGTLRDFGQGGQTYLYRGAFPPEARIVVQLHENVKRYVVPFKVENTDLLERPMK